MVDYIYASVAFGWSINSVPRTILSLRNRSLTAWSTSFCDDVLTVTTNRLRIPFKAHRFTCATYNPFEVLHLNPIGPLTKDAHGNEYILVIIDAFSRWVELFPTKSTTAAETASDMLNHIGRFGSPEVVHTDQGPAFHNELVQQLLRLCGIEQSLP